METIKSLKGINLNQLFEAFNSAFADYEMQLNKKELQNMLYRRGFVPELSFAAFNGDKIIGFTFNGIGTYDGQKMAYDTGTGTLKEYRGQGLATKIFLHSIPFLKQVGISQYLLEVLQHNTKAVSVYKNIGFKVRREFNYYVVKNEEIKLISKAMPKEYVIMQTTLSNQKFMQSFCDFIPSWQNSFAAIARKPDDFKILAAFHQHKLVGFCIFEPASGDVTQLAVDKNYRRKGIGSNLMHEALKFNLHHSVKIINTDTTCISVERFLTANNLQPKGKQFEMVKTL